MVSVRAFYSDDPSSNTADVCSFVCKNEFEKNEYKQKVAGVGPFFRIKRFYRHERERERERENKQKKWNGDAKERFFLVPTLLLLRRERSRSVGKVKRPLT